MKIFKTFPIMLILMLVVCNSASSQNKITVFDGRNINFSKTIPTGAEKDLADSEFKRNEAEIRKVLKSCGEDEPKNDGVQVIGIAQGSFTKPNTAQKVIFYERCRWWQSFGIAGMILLENEKPIAHFVYGSDLTATVSVLPDINKNGLSEIVMIGGTAFTSYSIAVIEINNEKINSFGYTEGYKVNVDEIVKGLESEMIAYKISAQPSANPVFFRETFKQKSISANKWGTVKKSEQFALEKISNLRFVKIELNADKR